jgi:hypothetical protein
MRARRLPSRRPARDCKTLGRVVLYRTCGARDFFAVSPELPLRANLCRAGANRKLRYSGNAGALRSVRVSNSKSKGRG